jgi:hypothetical protein
MAAITAIMGVGSSLYQGYQQSQAYGQQAAAAKQQGLFAASIDTQNAAAAENSAVSTEQAGDLNAAKLQTGAKLTMGQQTASYGAQGVQVGTGSAASVAKSTMDMSTQDANTIRLNAWQQAFGIKTQATNDLMQGTFSQMKGDAQAQAYGMAANTSLITGGLNAANQLASYKYNQLITSSGRYNFPR